MKFRDLSIKEKAAVIKLGVGGGLNSLLLIEKLYDGLGPDDPPIILKVNKSQADFVLRLKDPNREYIHDWENPDNITTHKLSWADDGVVYPLVLNVNGRLVDFSRPPYSTWAGYDNAVRNGDTIHMTPEEAEWFTTHYKDYYPGFNEYKKGGSIHIKPENRGKFNATKRRTGKTTEELTHSKNPLTRKRAIFALNAKKWNHKHPDGGPINPTLQQVDLARMRYKGYFDAMVNNGINPLYASNAAYYATQQSFAEMGWLPNKYNNYGGMKNSKGLISYPSEEAYFNAWVKNANNKWPEYFKSLSIEDWDEALNHTSLGLINEKLFNAYQKENPNTYIYAPIWENKSYLNKMQGVKNRMDASLDNYHNDYFMDYMLRQDPLNYNKGEYIGNDLMDKYNKKYKGGYLFDDGEPEDPPKRRLKTPEEILAEKYDVEPVVADNTNVVQQQVFTPQEKAYAEALQNFYQRHSSPKAEQKSLDDARTAANIEINQKLYENQAQFGTLSPYYDNRTWWAKNWPQAKRWIDNRFSLIGDLSDATNGIVDLKYFIPGIGQAVLVGDMAENLDNGNIGNAFVDGLFAFAPGYKNIENAGSQIANWLVKPHGFAGSYELRFKNVFSPSYWKEVRNPESYQDAVNQVKNFHDKYRVRKLGKISDDIIDKRNTLVELFDDPFRFDYSYENIKMPIIKTDRHGNIKSIKFDKKQQNLFDKNPVGKTEIRPMGPFRYIKENGLKKFLESTGVNHQGNLFDLNLFHPNIIGTNPHVLKGIAAHEMLHTAQTMIKDPYLNLSMPYNGYFGPNIFFETFRPDVRFDAMNAPDPQPDFIDRLIRFKDNAKSILGKNGLINKTPLKSRKSNQWFRSPDELDAEMANFRYLWNYNVPLKYMPVDLLNKAIDVMSRRFKVSSRDDMGNLMMQLSDIGYFSKGGPIKPFSYLPIPEVRY